MLEGKMLVSIIENLSESWEVKYIIKYLFMFYIYIKFKFSKRTKLDNQLRGQSCKFLDLSILI